MMTFFEPFYRRALYFGFGAFLTLCSFPFGYYLADANLHGGKAVFSLLVFAVVMGSGVALIATSLRYRLTLTPRVLTLRRAFGTWSISRKDIAGFQRVSFSAGFRYDALWLYAKGKRRHCFSIPCVFEDNAALMKWMAGIPDVR
jgi:hypothetical protein